MTKQLPNLAISVVALTACGNRVGLTDKINDGDLVKFCEDQVKCRAAIMQDVYMFYCVDSVQDARHQAQAFGCETEFNDMITCEMAEAEAVQCRSEYSDYDDWRDELEDSYYGYYGSSNDDDECEDEQEDYEECINDFLGIDDSNNTQPYYGYSTPYYGEAE